MEFEDGKKAIAQIYSATGEIAGVGFWVSGRYVLTCAHVVKACLSGEADPEGASVTISFPFVTGDRYQTQVVSYNFNETTAGDDMAVLRLEAIPQGAIQPIQLVPLTNFDSGELLIYGFLKGDGLGRRLTVKAQGNAVGGWVQIQATGLAIEDGCSGAPVWCQTLQAFVGMVVARDKKRPEAKLGFMIPTQGLRKAQQFILQQTLFDQLEPEQQALSTQITIAYEVCRPLNWLQPYQTSLSQRLEDLSRMSDGELKEPMLVQFVACLLNQELPDSIRSTLENWANRYTTHLHTLRVRLQDKQNCRSQTGYFTQQTQPCLLVSVKSHEVKERHYSINAWLIRDVTSYDPNTGQGAESLVIQNYSQYAEAEDLRPEDGIADDKIPVLLADYLDQVGDRGIDIQQLTVELLLPLTLMNEPIEQRSIPVEFGIPQALSKTCRVVVRSQERLEVSRFLGVWQTKWQRLETLLSSRAGQVFVPGIGTPKQIQNLLKSDDKLGLQLTRSPTMGNQGELGVLIGTGTPIAMWVRQNNPQVNWENQFAHQVFCCLDPDASDCQDACCLKSSCYLVPDGSSERTVCQSLQLGELPNRVALIRQNAPDLDEEINLEQSLELGHHLSFVWENPKRVPPKMLYSLKSL